MNQYPVKNGAMFTIRVKDLSHALDQTAESADGMARNAGEGERSFLRRTWSLSYAIQPLASDPLAFILNPANHRRHGPVFGEIFAPDHFPPPDRLRAMMLFQSDLPSEVERIRRKLVAATREKIAEHAPTNRCPSPTDREWTYRHFRELTSPGPLPTGFLNERRVHLNAHLAYHLGEIQAFADDCVQQPEFELLPLFWKGFLGWHCSSPAFDHEQMLKDVVLSPVEKPGKRRAALLMLWTRSDKTATELLQLTQQFPELNRPSVAYTGSGDLPITKKGRSPRSQEQREKRLENAVLAAPSGKDKRPEPFLKAVEEHFDASVRRSGWRQAVEGMSTGSLRALVCGGMEDMRLKVMQCLAAFTGFGEENWCVWRGTYAAERCRRLRAELVEWQAGRDIHGEVMKELDQRALLAREIQNWPRQAHFALCELLEPTPTSGSTRFRWQCPVIAGRNKIPRLPPRDPLLQSLVERLVYRVELPDCPPKPVGCPGSPSQHRKCWQIVSRRSEGFTTKELKKKVEKTTGMMYDTFRKWVQSMKTAGHLRQIGKGRHTYYPNWP